MADREDRRNEFIEAAERLFRENGIVDTTISSIVKEVNAAKGLFYYYFNSKDEVIEAVAEKYRKLFQEKIEVSFDADDFDEKLSGFIMNVTASLRDLRKNVEASVLSSESYEYSKRDAEKMLEELLDEGVRLNRLVIRNTKYLAALIIGGLVQLIAEDGTSDEEIRKLIDEILNRK